MHATRRLIQISIFALLYGLVLPMVGQLSFIHQNVEITVPVLVSGSEAPVNNEDEALKVSPLNKSFHELEKSIEREFSLVSINKRKNRAKYVRSEKVERIARVVASQKNKAPTDKNRSVINNEKPFQISAIEYSSPVSILAMSSLLKDFKLPKESEDDSNKLVEFKDKYLLAENISVESFKNDEENVLEDVINSRLAAGQKMMDSNELVSFDYGSKDVNDYPIAEETAHPKNPGYISKGLDSVISRYLTERERQREPRKGTSSAKKKNNRIAQSGLNPRGMTTQDAMAALDSHRETTQNSVVNIYMMNIQSGSPLFDGVFELGYSGAERFFPDSKTGAIKISKDLNGRRSIARSRYLSQFDSLPITTDLVIEKGNFDLFIPVVPRSMLERDEFVATKDNYLLVELPAPGDDIELDGKNPYEFVHFLNQEGKVTQDPKEAFFAFLGGVRPGNVLMTIYREGRIHSERVVFIEEGTVHYEPAHYKERHSLELELLEKNPLGVAAPLSIDPGALRFFNRETTSKESAIGVYQIEIPEYSLSGRPYLELNHLEKTLFVGTEKEKVVIPSQATIDIIMRKAGLDSLVNTCLVQINLSKAIQDVEITGELSHGPMGVEQHFLSANGSFSTYPTETSRNFFLSGNSHGIFNVRIEYLDGSEDYLTTFCSEKTYLIEQL